MIVTLTGAMFEPEDGLTAVTIGGCNARTVKTDVEEALSSIPALKEYAAIVEFVEAVKGAAYNVSPVPLVVYLMEAPVVFVARVIVTEPE